MKNKSFITPHHIKTQRNYLERASSNKAQCARIAKEFGKDYWDGDRAFGYGGYKYDGRWESTALDLINTYKLNKDSRVLDIGCGKGFLLYELKKIIPTLEIHGIDISRYAIDNAKSEVKPYIRYGNAKKLDLPDNHFDFIISNSTLHNLYINELFTAIDELERVKKNKGHSLICVESYRNEEEKLNLLNWQLTCECFFTPDEWKWIFEKCQYSGDYELIYFE